MEIRKKTSAKKKKKSKREQCQGFRRTKGGRWTYNGKNVSAQVSRELNEMSIPPGWSNVVVSNDPKSSIVAVGQDAQGRWQYRYSEEHIAAKKREKFDRVKLFTNDMEGIRTNIGKGIKRGDPEAYLLRLEDKTGIRVGSDKDVKAKVKAYGLTTLQGRHVSVDKDRIFMDFIAKEGIRAQYEVKDPIVAKFLKKRLETAGDMEALFPDVNNTKINKYLKGMSGGKKYTIKDYRTYNGTKIAHKELQKYSGKVYTDKEKLRIAKEVSTTASQFLKNSPKMALDSYIDPLVWDVIGGLP
jgi:DNA topoisomerase-1